MASKSYYMTYTDKLGQEWRQWFNADGSFNRMEQVTKIANKNYLDYIVNEGYVNKEQTPVYADTPQDIVSWIKDNWQLSIIGVVCILILTR